MAPDASFNIVTLSISPGFKRSIPPARSGTPSITIKGPLSPNVFVPRIRIMEPSPPGSPLRCMAVTPGKRPANELERFIVGDLSSSEPLTEATDPVTVALRCVP